jgi:Domain of unknown function (DUF4384)
VLAQGDGRISVQLTAVPPALRIGRDYLDLQLKSSHDGFVYLILLGSDEKSFYLLFPNALDRDNRIAAGQTLQLPRPSWRIQSQGPPGRDVLLGVVAESARDLASIEREKNGPFTTVLSDMQGRAQLQWLLGRSGIAEMQRTPSAPCASTSSSDDCALGLRTTRSRRRRALAEQDQRSNQPAGRGEAQPIRGRRIIAGNFDEIGRD